MKLLRIPKTQERVLARLRKLCLALPEAREEVKWGHPNWTVRGKIFASYGAYQDRFSFGSKQTLPDQELLVEDARFFRSPYVGKHGWVSMYVDGDVDWGMAAVLILRSYGLVAPKTLAAQVDQAPAPARRKKA